MIKLKEIVQRLDDENYSAVESSLIKNKAENFLFLLQSYRQDDPDEDIISELKLNSNSFYVLKSRLYDKIQETLCGDIYQSPEELLKKLNDIPIISVSEPREVAIAYLQKLEKDLLEFDMHYELLVVYSALKKMFVYSQRYFHYSQLYNKHIAFNLSLEKTEENLANFNRVFGEYSFSKSEKFLETLLFLRKEIYDHYQLNGSRQIEIIKNIVDLQLIIFCDLPLRNELNADKLMTATEKLISELPEKSAQKIWYPLVSYLRFEHNLRIGQMNEAAVHYRCLRENENNLLLLSHIGFVCNYFISKIVFCQRTGAQTDISSGSTKDVLYDSDDAYSVVKLGIYEAMICYYNGNIKEAAAIVNKLLNEYSFKDLFHINAELKLTLAFFYLKLKEFDLAESFLKGVYRKIKSDKIEGYNHALDLIKVFELDIKQAGNVSAKQKDFFALFQARNRGENELLRYMNFELEKKYS